MKQAVSTLRWTLPILCGLALSNLRAGFVETFEDGTNEDGWSLTTSTEPVIEPSGGNPGAYLRQEVDTSTPTWGTSFTLPNHFLGNYVKLGVDGMSFDLEIFAGIGGGVRNVTLFLYSKKAFAYNIGADISELPKGWHTYGFQIGASSSTIPPGWKVIRDGHVGTNADWRALIQDVEFVGCELGTPGYIYPIWVWDIGLDNVRIAKRYRPPDGD